MSADEQMINRKETRRKRKTDVEERGKGKHEQLNEGRKGKKKVCAGG